MLTFPALSGGGNVSRVVVVKDVREDPRAVAGRMSSQGHQQDDRHRAGRR
jgi:hypothetical protein